MTELRISFGALSDSLRKQIKDQGYPPPTMDELAVMQADAEEIARLNVRGLLSDAETRRARNRLMKTLTKAIEAALRAKGLADIAKADMPERGVAK